ncbi:TetR/AcrR family transcriptional regulator [Mycolicibacterium sp. S2-37]|uniref:TetR/AcrR family transcriptional regulator n=1 Tax=Mycolicibacterium sp. S2-37 TaxID=2810297 RepID=UPI001A9455D0|nr:TetR family transcriptional regulator [Mycolicibacterium sp. S2-37]MBO0679053.1 TetR/AcrR family transcriptional regulator [Mycolicibacterium sp. S2-37]
MGARKDESRRRRDAVFAATWELVETQGFSAVTMRQVAERAGVALGTIFLYASNKDELLLQVFGERLAARWDSFLKSSAAEAPLRRVEAFYDDCLTMFFADVDNIGAYYALLLRYPTATFPEVVELRSRLRRILRGSEGLPPDDVAALEQAYYGVFAMAVLEHVHVGDETRTRATMARSMAMLRRGAVG